MDNENGGLIGSNISQLPAYNGGKFLSEHKIAELGLDKDNSDLGFLVMEFVKHPTRKGEETINNAVFVESDLVGHVDFGKKMVGMTLREEEMPTLPIRYDINVPAYLKKMQGPEANVFLQWLADTNQPHVHYMTDLNKENAYFEIIPPKGMHVYQCIKPIDRSMEACVKSILKEVTSYLPSVEPDRKFAILQIAFADPRINIEVIDGKYRLKHARKNVYLRQSADYRNIAYGDPTDSTVLANNLCSSAPNHQSKHEVLVMKSLI
jgi:hypothetical protein